MYSVELSGTTVLIMDLTKKKDRWKWESGMEPSRSSMLLLLNVRVWMERSWVFLPNTKKSHMLVVMVL